MCLAISSQAHAELNNLSDQLVRPNKLIEFDSTLYHVVSRLGEQREQCGEEWSALVQRGSRTRAAQRARFGLCSEARVLD
jgi:hypothetical protein